MLHVKDYYKILEVPPSANISEIKSAYRKLAKQYHPDIQSNNPYASARFTEIKEAYEVLSHPNKKEKYLQQRWYQQSLGKRNPQDILTPESVLKQVLELERYISRLDHFRTDHPGLKQYLSDIFPDAVIDRLHSFEDPEMLRQIVKIILRIVKPMNKMYGEDILRVLRKFAKNDRVILNEINNYILQHHKKIQNEKNIIILVFVLTILITLIIYLAAR